MSPKDSSLTGTNLSNHSLLQHLFVISHCWRTTKLKIETKVLDVQSILFITSHIRRSAILGRRCWPRYEKKMKKRNKILFCIVDSGSEAESYCAGSFLTHDVWLVHFKGSDVDMKRMFDSSSSSHDLGNPFPWVRHVCPGNVFWCPIFAFFCCAAENVVLVSFGCEQKNN